MANNILNTSQEIWKAIPGFPGYEVSNMGRVRSFWINGYHKLKTDSHIITPSLWKKSSNYARFHIDLRIDGKRIHSKVHTLVLLAFCGPRPKGMEGCHSNGNGLDNNLNNLRWDTTKNNILDSINHGTRKRKLTPDKVIEMRNRWENKESLSSLSKRFGIAQRNVFMVVHRKAWKHIL